MLKVKIGPEAGGESSGVFVMASGDLQSISAEVAIVINGVHSQLARSNPALGKAFRVMMTQLIIDPDTPLWEIHDAGNGTCITFPKNIKEDM